MLSDHFFVFFFKQKTAYEMRISDWSSDVRSSDLLQRRDAEEGLGIVVIGPGGRDFRAQPQPLADGIHVSALQLRGHAAVIGIADIAEHRQPGRPWPGPVVDEGAQIEAGIDIAEAAQRARKSTSLNSSH